MNGISRITTAGMVLGLVALSSTWSAGQEILVRLDGEEPFALFGNTTVGLGDVDGDAVPDLAVGAPQELGLGAVYVYSGRVGSLLYRIGSDRTAALGVSLAALDDVNGDGRADLAVGAPWYERKGGAHAGTVFLFSGADGSTIDRIHGANDNDAFGLFLANVGDLDGDGLADLAIATEQLSPDHPGVVETYSSATRSLLWRVEGEDWLEGYGQSITALSDRNGDGIEEVAIGAPDRRVPGAVGAVEIRDGRTGAPIATLQAVPGDSGFGRALASVLDRDGDGRRDLAVGVTSLRGFGGVALHSSAHFGLLAVLRHPERHRRADFGAAIAAVGDANGDGFEDLFVGAPADGQQELRGSATLFSGRTMAPLHTFVELDSRLTGQALAGVGDLDGDGLAEMIIGAPQSGDAATGRAFVLRGNDLYLRASDVDPVAGDLLALTTREGPAGGPLVLFVTSFDDVPCQCGNLTGIVRFDASSTHRLRGTVPQSLSGHSLTVRAFALDAGGGVIDSADERVVIQ